ncbi:hypothetical protein K9U40_20915 [Xanthobacter autotrophicus]|uniref:hypothetical protein n=1 Tax=Xanthobacter TaxID=279 RepID=UPI0024AB6039|nr:hypothetical protein [Xanthobacter autotrophicus]MDI4666761.1 hypothetical protein [Xanthobacter autotrophicus]
MAKLNTFSFRQLPRLRNGARRNGSVSSAGLMRLRAGTSMAALFIPAGFLDADTPFLHEDEGRFPALQAAGPRPPQTAHSLATDAPIGLRQANGRTFSHSHGTNINHAA